MIQPNEIRLGNIIKIRGIVTELDYRTLGKLFKNSNADDLNHLEGIGLTPEILEKSGFKNSNPLDRDNRFYCHPNFQLEIGYITNDEFYQSDVNKDIITIKYVHQLQNLYFALTGKELDIKL